MGTLDVGVLGTNARTRGNPIPGVWMILSMIGNLPDKLGTSAVGTSELVRATR